MLIPASRTRRLLLLSALGAAAAATGPAAGQDPDKKCTAVALDPGHDSKANPATEPIGPRSKTRKVKDGGGTRGVATGTPEHVITLQVAKRLRRVLEERGYCVVMTRDRATGLSMGNVARARIANRAGAALFVRIHADGSTSRSQHGSSTLYPALHDGWTDDILPASREAARLVQSELVARVRSRDLGTVERGDLTGFNWADVPAVLVELGFMTNPDEDRRLNDAKHQKRAALGMARGIERFAPP
jgi:N-acetylmuramoyl-L-alanine amidase